MIIAETLSREIYHKALPMAVDCPRVHAVCIFLRNYLSLTVMRPYIAKESCNECGECVETCPYEVFRNEAGAVVVAIPEDCIECTACVDSCPHEAISMGD
jgi:NAD-dependent dihydropyrimidine dehydrogenase PreA subunit